MVSWDDGSNPKENHYSAARQLADKLGWDGTWVGGDYESGYAFVNTDVAASFVVTKKET